MESKQNCTNEPIYEIKIESQMQKTNTVTEGKWGRDKLENWDRYTYAEVVKVLLVSRV